MNFEIYTDTGLFKWRLLDPLGVLVGQSSIGYATVEECEAAIDLIQGGVATATRPQAIVRYWLVTSVVNAAASHVKIVKSRKPPVLLDGEDIPGLGDRQRITAGAAATIAAQLLNAQPIPT